MSVGGILRENELPTFPLPVPPPPIQHSPERPGLVPTFHMAGLEVLEGGDRGDDGVWAWGCSRPAAAPSTLRCADALLSCSAQPDVGEPKPSTSSTANGTGDPGEGRRGCDQWRKLARR